VNVAPKPSLSAPRVLSVLGLLALGAAFALLLSVALGEYPLSLKMALRDATSADARVLYALRLPRALLAALVGGALGVSGSALQALLKNPLAEPFVLGVSGGAALGATLAIVLGQGALFSFAAPSLFAFAGSVGATGLVFAAARRRPGAPYAALLTGVIFNAFAAAAITCIKTLSAPDKVGEILYWLAGTLGYERPSTLALAGALVGLSVGALVALSPKLNLLGLGDEDAASLGVHVERVRLIALLASSLSVAAAVALSGLVGFVGLIVPHVLRLWLGPDQRLLVPASALGGAGFLMIADLLTRLSFPLFHAEPPVGVVTAVLGGPLFLWLLNRRGAEAR
jgi:iron complex transport system permease protein